MGIARTSETLITQRHTRSTSSTPVARTYQLLSSYSILNSLCLSKRCPTRERRTLPVKLWSYFNIDMDSCGLACKQQSIHTVHEKKHPFCHGPVMKPLQTWHMWQPCCCCLFWVAVRNSKYIWWPCINSVKKKGLDIMKMFWILWGSSTFENLKN